MLHKINVDEVIVAIKATPPRNVVLAALFVIARADGPVNNAELGFLKQVHLALGLDRLAPEEFALFQDLNSRYREKFGFPFVICVRRTDKAGILSAFHQRLEADQAAEQAAALNEIHHIAGLRLADLVQDEFSGHAV